MSEALFFTPTVYGHDLRLIDSHHTRLLHDLIPYNWQIRRLGITLLRAMHDSLGMLL
jgi:hypothetical protein